MLSSGPAYAQPHGYAQPNYLLGYNPTILADPSAAHQLQLQRAVSATANCADYSGLYAFFG